MALLLRSKHLRLLTSVSRSFRYRLYIVPASPAHQCNDQILRNFARDFSIKTAPIASQDTSLDRSLRRLDQDARRAGRISKRELEDVIEELRHAGSATSAQSLLLIRCCGSLVPEELPETRTQLVQGIWKTLENLGVPMDISHYNALLRVYLENEYSFSPTEFLADLEKKGIEPNRVTYQRLIARYCQEGDMEGATHILEFMRSKQLPVNESVFNALILGHSQANDIESALGILGVMKQAGLEPSAETYTTLLCGYGKMGDIASIKDILRQCEQNDVSLSGKDFMDIIYALAVNGHTQHVDEIISQLTTSTGFNHDAVNLILRLVNKKQLDTAKKILLKMPRPTRNGELLPVGTFFVRQLVKAKCPIEDTVAHCVALEDAGLNSRALLVATETCLQLGPIENSFHLFSTLQSRGHPIRSHFFWPLVAIPGNSNDEEGILNVLKAIQDTFQRQVGGEILREYAVPHLYRLSSENNKALDVITKLNSNGVSKASAAVAVVFHLLTANNISGAAAISKQFRALYSPSLLRRPLLQAFKNTRDGAAFAVILRQMYDSAGRLAELQSSSSSSSSSDDEDVVVADRLEMVGYVVLEAVRSLPANSPEKVVQLLKGLKDQGLGFSNSVAERLVEKLGSESLNADISDLLEKLTSGEIVTEINYRPRYGLAGEAQLLNIIQGARGERALNAKRQLLSLHCRNKEVEKAENLKKELERENAGLTAGHIAQLIDLYVTTELLDKALELYNMYKEKGFTLDRIKVIKLATLLAKNGRLEEALQHMESQAPTTVLDDVSFVYNSACRNLLFCLADQGQVDELFKVFDALVENKYVEVTNVMLGPLVKVHIVRNDLDGALRQFEQCVMKYQCTPWKNELSCKLIEAEDAASLQKLTDLSTKVHGEINSLYDLVFAFLECGRVRQARKILETPGLYMRSQRVNSACKRFQTEGMTAPLEGLVEATKELPHIDRSDICQHLLLSYCQNKDAEKALGLWTRMQEEDIQPSDEFLYILGNFLKESGMNVPFAIPNMPPPPQEDAGEIDVDALPLSADAKKCINLVQQEKFLDALTLYIGLNKEDKLNISKPKYSELLEGVVINGSVAQVGDLLTDLLKNEQFPVNRIFKFALKKLATAGDMQTLIDLRKYLNVELRRVVTYDTKLCEAFVVSGQGSAYLEKLENASDGVSDPEVLKENIPGGLMGLLEKHPEFLERTEKLALKYYELGIDSPMNMVWMHLLLSHNFDQADQIWKKYLKPKSRLLFSRVLRVARQNADEDMARCLVSHLKDSSLSSAAIGLAYCCLLDVQLMNKKFDEAFNTYLEVEEKNMIGSLHPKTVTNLQEAAKDSGKEIMLPQKS